MKVGLEGAGVLVTGSSRGIGRAIADAFLGEGARVTLNSRDTTSLNAVAAELALVHGADRISIAAGDVTNKESAAQVVATARERWGALEALVLNVGTGSGAAGPTPGEEEWQRLLDANLWSSINVAEAALPEMIDSQRGAIVFVGSIASAESIGAPLPYGAAKAALVAYAGGLARLVGPSSVRVNVVAPGNVLFPGGSWERLSRETPDAVSDLLAREVPLGRFGTPEEIANVVVFLCSTAASFVTGTVVVADGGQTRAT